MRRLIVIITAICSSSGLSDAVRAADLILNEYNAVRASRWLDCDGLDCSTCGGPPCKADNFFGRVQGNGGNWIELVVTSNHTDIRGWRLEWTEDPSDAGTLTLTDDPLWADLRAGTIITFTELESAAGGLDTDTGYDPNGGDWWININTLSSGGTPHTQYVTTVTNVLGDSLGAFSVGNDNWQLTILDADSNVVFGPAGEGIRFVCDGGPLDDEPCSDPGDCDGALCEQIRVSSREVFKLQEDPGAGIDPVTSNYKDGTSSTFGHRNIWSGGDKSQDFTCIRCDDGVFCNGAETCDADSVCQPGAAPCVDLAHCDEDTSTCPECIDASECDDGDTCTDDTCDGGSCHFAAIPGCNDGNETPSDADSDGVADALDECPDTPGGATVDEQGCNCSQVDQDDDLISDCFDLCPDSHAGAVVDDHGCSCDQLDCDDGLFCTGVEACDEATVTCISAGDPCPETMICIEEADGCDECSDDVHCDDGVECTLDRCVAGTCAFELDDERCSDDGSFCNGTEFCDATLGCVSAGAPCASNENCDEDIDMCGPADTPIGQPIPTGSLCGAMGSSCGPMGSSVGLILLALRCLRIVNSPRRRQYIAGGRAAE